MPRLRRRISQVSTSSEHSTNSNERNNSNLNDDLPDIGLNKKKPSDAKDEKKISVNFPVEVITKSGKFSGMGTINLVDTTSVERTVKLRKTKAELKEFMLHEHDSQKLIQNKQEDEIKKINQEKPQEKSKANGDSKKEKAKEARELKKREEKAKKEAIRKGIEDEKRAEADFEAFHQIYKKECLKFISIEIHPVLAGSWFMSDTIREAASIGVRVVPADDICEPGLLVWTRRVSAAFASEGGQVRLAPTKHQSPHALLVMPAEQLCELAVEGRELQHVTERHALAQGTRALLLLAHTTRDAQSYGMTPQKLAEKITDLQIELLVSLQMDLVLVQNPTELASLLVHYTRAVAEAPYKKAKRDLDEQANFFMRGDNKNCVTVDKDGNGLSRLWEQMVAVLPHSSLEVARSLGAEYRTPRSLLQAFQSTGGMSKVSNIPVSRTNVPGAKSRRLGPEFARKLHTLFTAEDGNTVIE